MTTTVLPEDLERMLHDSDDDELSHGACTVCNAQSVIWWRMVCGRVLHVEHLNTGVSLNPRCQDCYGHAKCPSCGTWFAA